MFSILAKQAIRTRGFATATNNHAFANAKRNAKTGFYKKNWLSDPSTYPLIVVMGSALALVTGVGGSCLMYNPDVQINPDTRGSIMRGDFDASETIAAKPVELRRRDTDWAELD